MIISACRASHGRRVLRRVWPFRRNFSSEMPVLHEDEHILAILKPSGLSVHGGASVRKEESVIGRLTGVSSRPSLFLVHRLDAPTTGALVLAKSKHVATLLERAFSEGLVTKKYIAAVVPEQDHGPWRRQGTIDADVGGKPATTHFTTLAGRQGPCRLLELIPTTGRTHQLRIHCATSLGAPILGDTKYGRTRLGPQRDVLDQLGLEKRNSPPLFLHCETLRVPYIKETAREISLVPALFTSISAPLPDHFRTLATFTNS